MEYKNLLLDVNEHIAIVSLNRPDKLNALNHATLVELKSVFELLKSDENVFVVIVTGSGEKAFVAGADISEINKLNMLEGKSLLSLVNPCFHLLKNLISLLLLL